MVKKKIDDMSIEELETEAGVILKDAVRKQAIEERLYEKYKGVGKRQDMQVSVVCMCEALQVYRLLADIKLVRKCYITLAVFEVKIEGGIYMSSTISQFIPSSDI